MRAIGLDIHRDFCEVAIKDESGLRLAGRHILELDAHAAEQILGVRPTEAWMA